jgi:geranylgeranyl pyrophosphate synthase
MADTTMELILKVPERQQRRIQLNNAARAVVAVAPLNPPVTLIQLEQLATEVISVTDGYAEELAFAMLLCSNELWRPWFEATDYNRRLLILPQCLKNNSSCSALVDDMGLICAGCNQCSINSVLNEAEARGYATLVAEGTSSALTLVEEGSVDAILGVSCLESLQKSFSKVVSSSIPSLAIPLLNNGCSNTEVDNAWLLNEINTQSINHQNKPISVSLLKQHIENLFSAEFLFSEFGHSTHSSNTGNLAVNAMLLGGKRMRPLLTLIAYSAYARSVDRQVIDRLLVAVECFHKASLIHDDIEDDDDYRYDRKTTHYENGIPQAINAGDYLIGQGYRILSQLPISGDIKLKLFDLFTTLHVESTIGQGEELALLENKTITGIEDTLTIFKQKTGSAIQVSLLTGAIAAEASDAELSKLATFSELFGIAYQIRDDLTEFQGTAIDQKSVSFPFLKSILVEMTHLHPSTEEQWKTIIIEHQIDNIARDKLNETLQQLRACSDQLESQKMRLALLGVINPIFEIQ